MKSISINEFCVNHGISRTLYFKLQEQGMGPRTMKLGKRVLITEQAVADWIATHEKQKKAA
ncbi:MULTISPECIES: transcriptional regulator [unclassified Bradyrhizobium]|uniref:transcriptional regulator n=1 Tax=unclassified Bradyrhizobium TaxID=2631580 RepID=UPI00291684C4|nr:MULTISPECIES: transcriptional regulator [unclassified Bradyrhizobium]